MALPELEREMERRLKCGPDSPLLWPSEIAKCFRSLPSPELGRLLVSHLCFRNNHPSLWKFLHYALSSRLLCPLHVLSLLASRVVPNRGSQPEAYRLYLELLAQFALSFDPSVANSFQAEIIQSVDAALKLSPTYGSAVVGFGQTFLFFFCSIITNLIDSTLDDWGLQMPSPAFRGGMAEGNHRDINSEGDSLIERNERREQMKRNNSIMAIDVIGKLTESSKALVLLRLIYLNMPEKFEGLLQRLQLLEASKVASSNLKPDHQIVARLSASIRRIPRFQYQLKTRRMIAMLVNFGSQKPISCGNFGSHQSACWVPFDIYMESAMDGKQLSFKSSVVILTETIHTLQVLNRASWQETFLALWLSALRLVQRERDPLEGPIPHLESRLCVLLCIVPLAISNVLQEESESTSSSLMLSDYGHELDERSRDKRKHALISSLQLLGNFSELLCPPTLLNSSVNNAAVKAARLIASSKNSEDYLFSGSPTGIALSIGGNMRHLIVEACIARNLIDTSAYFWPGYVSASAVSLPDLSISQKPPWSAFMEGAALNASLVNLLSTTPASRLAEVEKVYHLALNGSGEEKLAAAKIICGASLTHGWNIQEHVVKYVVKLLSPPVPPGYNAARSHLIDYMPMLSGVICGASSIDSVHILSLHGLIPEVAAALMPLCETFGSLIPASSTDDEPSIHMVFSTAFLFLLRLWKFYKPPLDQGLTEGTMRGELTLEYLLLLRNSRITVQNSGAQGVDQFEFSSDKPIYIDYFPKLRAWYCQNRSCIASTLSALCSGNPVHQVANKILSMIFWKMTKAGASSGTPSSNPVCGSPVSTAEDACPRPMLPAWEILEAIPFVLDAILTACAHGRLSSRDMTTGLRDLVDFLPASAASIVSYFSAEATRGVWKPVQMNGTDWPSPAAILPLVKSEMKEILAAVGVDAPSSSAAGDSPVMLSLPMAALVSLTITFKLTKDLEYIHAVVGPALESCASGCLWANISIIGSLWAQKVRRWHNFIVVSCSRSVFKQDKQALTQLLRSCFISFIGSFEGSVPSLINQGGVNGLLGRVLGSPDAPPRVAPGFLYLRSCRAIQDIRHVNNVIIGLVAEFARESAARWTRKDCCRLKSSQASLCRVAACVREVATLGASLLSVTGGLHLVQELYRGTLPTWLLTAMNEKPSNICSVSRILEGYAMAYLLVLSGSIVWGVGSKPPLWASSRRACVVGAHLEFLGRVLDGNISLGCDPVTWKAYISCFVGLMVSCAPSWTQGVKLETLQRVASGLKGWHECELALSLLERGGVDAIESMINLVNAVG